MSRSGDDTKGVFRRGKKTWGDQRYVSSLIGSEIDSERLEKAKKINGIKLEFWLELEKLLLKGVKLENAIVLAKREIKYRPEFKSIFDKYDFNDFLKEWHDKGRDVEVLKKMKQQEKGKDDNEKS